ncbi:MAG: group II truncated hemoglobin [Betaproteobacteria bacterium]
MDDARADSTVAETPYARVGGEAGVRALVERFYDLMEMEPAFAAVRAVHAESLATAREKLYLFLSGWLGGPPLYVERYGHPKLRARHLPFAIGTIERDQWLACMRRTLADTGVPDSLAAQLMPAFFQTADWMRNVER